MAAESRVSAPVLITGGTGTLGRLVVARLLSQGSQVWVLSRREHQGAGRARFLRGDLSSGRGLDACLNGVATVVHCASGRKGDAEMTANLVRAARAAGVGHLVFISIVGIEIVSMGYFQAKLAAERVVTGSGIPCTVLRATQFYDLILTGARWLSRLPLVLVPRDFLSQPVDAGEVAARLVSLSRGDPQGRVSDMGGPQVRTFADLVRAYLRSQGRRRQLVAIPVPRTAPIRQGGLLVRDRSGAQLWGKITWEDFLSRPPSRSVPATWSEGGAGPRRRRP
ncbi:MAG: SDR family oxidoreductase [Candidatus Dormibacteria bacterium]